MQELWSSASYEPHLLSLLFAFAPAAMLVVIAYALVMRGEPVLRAWLCMHFVTLLPLFVTITLVEKTQAVKANSASTDRSGNITATPAITGPISHLFKGSDVSGGAGATFAGKGAAAQSNQLDGEISVTVAQIYPNGTMLVRGEKLLTLNRGDENINITGIIRCADIGPDNRVLSTRVADARITYSGKGEIARASRQGWLNRFFSMLSPF